MGVRDADPVACVEHRPLRFPDAVDDGARGLFRHFLRHHLPVLSPGRAVLRDLVAVCGRAVRSLHVFDSPSGAARQVILRVKSDKVICVDICALDVQRDIQPGGAGPSHRGKPDGLLQTEPDAQGVDDHLAVFCHGGDGRADVKLLVAHGADVHA